MVTDEDTLGGIDKTVPSFHIAVNSSFVQILSYLFDLLC